MENHKVYKMSFSKLYPLYIQKAEKKNRTKDEVDSIICWLTGYSNDCLKELLNENIDIKSFFESAPQINPNVSLIKGVVCGVRVEEIEDPVMRKIRYLDKLIDELAKGKKIDDILRK